MRQAVRAIIIKDDQIVVMHRNKFGHEYYTLVGGGIDAGEEPEQALIREVQEETGLEISNPKLVFIEEAGDPYGTQYIYLCTYIGGEPELHPESEEANINKLGQNLYTTQWLKLTELTKVEFLSSKLKEQILKGVAEGFPVDPVKIDSKN